MSSGNAPHHSAEKSEPQSSKCCSTSCGFGFGFNCAFAAPSCFSFFFLAFARSRCSVGNDSVVVGVGDDVLAVDVLIIVGVGRNDVLVVGA